jgi:hypothetical protein
VTNRFLIKLPLFDDVDGASSKDEVDDPRRVAFSPELASEEPAEDGEDEEEAEGM